MPQMPRAPTADRPRGVLYGWLPIVLIAVVAVGVYANSIPNGFLYDDQLIVLDDPRTCDLSRWREVFTRGYWYRRSADPIYRPIPLLTYAVNHAVTGFSPAGYRAVNVALHAGVSVLVFAIALELSRRRWAAVGAGLLFAVHPIHGEVVVIVIGRADLLCTFFYLLGVWQLLRERVSTRSRFTPRFAGVLVLLGLALLSKENAVTFVGAAVLVDLWRRGRVSDGLRVRPWRGFLLDRFLARYLPMLLVIGAVLLIRYQVVGRLTRPHGVVGGGIDNPLDAAGLVGRLLTPLVLWGKSLNLLVWPHPLCYDYSYNAVPMATSLSDGRVLAGLAWVVLVAAVTVASWRRGRLFAWCVGFFVIAYSLVSNTVVLIGTLFAERLLYLPSAAWCWTVALAVAAIYERVAATGPLRRVAGGAVLAVAACALLTYGAKTVVRNGGALANNDALYAEGLRVNPDSSRCQAAAAQRFMRQGDHQAAIRLLSAALAIDDTAWYDHFLIGQEYILDGQIEPGLTHLRRADELAMGRYHFEPAFLMGQVLVRTNRAGEAIDWLERARRIKPDHAPCLANLALALAEVDPPRRDMTQADAHLSRALAIARGDLRVLELAYAFYVTCRRPQRAAAVARQALEILPPTHKARSIWRARLDTDATRP